MAFDSLGTMVWPLASSSVACLLAWTLYRISHLSMIPGEPDVIVLMLPSSKGWSCPHPWSSVFSPLSFLRARWAWAQLAKERGLSSKQLAGQIRDDDSYDWVNGEKPAIGDLVRGWDRVMVWDEDCFDLSILERWRDISDRLADDVLDSLSHDAPIPDRRDPLRTVHESLKIPFSRGKREDEAKDNDAEPLRRFWRSVDCRPPRGCGAVSMEWYQKRGDEAIKKIYEEAHAPISSICFDEDVAEEIDDDVREALDAAEMEEEASVLKRGKETFYRYGPPILVAMLHAGLAGGFASPRIMTVLRATGYLVPPKPRNADERLELSMKAATDGKEVIERDSKRHPMYFQSSSNVGDDDGQVPSDAAADRTFKRLLETSQFVLDVMDSEDSLLPPSARQMRRKQNLHDGEASEAKKDNFGVAEDDSLSNAGAGWLSAIRVRFIHASVRRRLSKGSLSSSYDISTAGVPINQEDLLATLCSFSIAPLWSLQRMGLTPTQQERQDYIALWRHVGFYMGIEPQLLRRCFRDVDSAERFFASVASHHFLPVVELKKSPAPVPLPRIIRRKQDVAQYLKKGSKGNGGGMRGPALPLLYSIAERPPRGMSFASHCAIARHLLGDALANAVELPGMTRRQYWAMRLQVFALVLPPLFARYYPRRAWGVALGVNAKEVLRRLTDFAMAGMVPGKGGKRTTYELRGEQKIPWEEACYVPLDMQEGERMRNDYFALMTEASAVLLLCLVTPLAAVAYLTLR